MPTFLQHKTGGDIFYNTKQVTTYFTTHSR